ncbi:YrzI family small protein [Fredinandcohnia sp. 179-A 10B2 NHS]
MTLHLLFLTISINKREMTIEHIQKRNELSKVIEEQKHRQFSVYHM